MEIREQTEKNTQIFAFFTAVSVCVLLAAGFATSSFLRLSSSFEIDLENRLNPNVATSGSLTRLPGIGAVRAEAIVAYREGFNAQQISGNAFGNCDDLQKVRGIGPKTVGNIKRWLEFE